MALPQPHRRPAAARTVIAAGVCAALHVGKLAPAMTALTQSLGLTLVQAGFLLSMVQGAGMLLGLALGALADGLGGRRSMLCGLIVLAGAGALGGGTDGVAALMVLRAAEGFGFLLVVLPAPGLLRRLVVPARLNIAMGVWSTYMPLATALALLTGPACIAALGWRGWWWALAALTAAMAVALARVVPAGDADGSAAADAAVPGREGLWRRLRRTLAAPAAWWVALSFASYSGQWLAVIGFLPTVYAQAGVPPVATGLLTALAAAVNMTGNLGAGRLLQCGVLPLRLLRAGFVAMAICAAAAFGTWAGHGLPPALRYAAVLAFSGIGGLVPATLFALALRIAPDEGAIATTVGWMQQWSAFGQFAGPPAVAWVASAVGGWQLTWVVTAGLALAGLALSMLLGRALARLAAVALRPRSLPHPHPEPAAGRRDG